MVAPVTRTLFLRRTLIRPCSHAGRGHRRRAREPRRCGPPGRAARPPCPRRRARPPRSPRRGRGTRRAAGRPPRRAGGLGDQAVVLQHVGGGGLDREVPGEQLGRLHPGHGAGQGPRVQHVEEAGAVQSVPVGEVERLGEPGHLGDQEEVDGELHQQRARHRTAVEALPAHRGEQRAQVREDGVVARQHRDEPALLGGDPGAGDGGLGVGASDGAYVLLQRRGVLGGRGAHVDDGASGHAGGEAGVPRPSTASTAASSVSISSTVSARSKTSAGLAATSAPASRRGAHRSGVRFPTTSGVPARARLSAMGRP